ncbi:MAG: NTP transferase domain-containing protein [Raoultibacter sp.]
MHLTRIEFEFLHALMLYGDNRQRKLAAETGLSLGSVNAAKKNLEKNGFIENGKITLSGCKMLDRYRVKNAIVMAAGLSSRFAPISYEKPKGLFRVRGEVLIERQIRQLQEAGISDITVVVGYKKEHFFYLEDELGVQIAVNSEFAFRNNNSSLMAVSEKLGNTYICSSDDYFTENPFEQYVFQPYYAAEYREGSTAEWCLTTGSGGRIVGVEVGGRDSLVMIGHAYFDHAFSQLFVKVLTDEYALPLTADKLWEELYVDHIKEFNMVVRPYDPGIIYEFDTLDELRKFDPEFLSNVDSEIFNNIATTLHCDKKDICNIFPLKQGLTNLSCHFSVNDSEYVYRHPGVGTEKIINRHGEVAAQKVAKELGLDETFIYEDPEKGWKISHFIPNCRQLDPKNTNQVQRAMQMARKLHGEKVSLDQRFDFFLESKHYEELLGDEGSIDVTGFYELARKAERLKSLADGDRAPVCLTHNDFFMLNFLIDERDKMYLIDWEYAGMSDYASDFGTFVVCCQLSEQEARQALSFYFGQEPTFADVRHNFAYVGLAGWCWYVWALFKEAEGELVGEWLYIYYSYAKEYIDKALALYDCDERVKGSRA